MSPIARLLFSYADNDMNVRLGMIPFKHAAQRIIAKSVGAKLGFTFLD